MIWVDDRLLSCTAYTFDACRKPITRHTSLGELHENDQQETWHVPTTNRPGGRDFGWKLLRYVEICWAAPRDFSSAGWNHDNHVCVECWGMCFVMFRHVSSNLWWNQTTHFSVASQGPSATWVKHPCDAPAKDSTVMVEVAHTSTTGPTVSPTVYIWVCLKMLGIFPMK